MKKILTKVLGSTMLIIMSIAFLGGCGTSSTSVKNTPEAVMAEFMKFRKSGEIDKLKDLISGNYLAAQDLDYDEYVQNIKDFDFKNSFEILDYKISDLVEVNENVKKVNVILKYSNNLVTNSSLDEVYGLINEDGQWKVSPLGVIDSYSYKYEGEASEGKLSMYVDKLINLIDGAVINIKISNKSEYDFSLGWVDASKVIIETDKGQYIETVPPLSKITRGMNDSLSIEVKGMEGELKKVTVTSIYTLSGALPILGSSGEDVVIFDNTMPQGQVD